MNFDLPYLITAFSYKQEEEAGLLRYFKSLKNLGSTLPELITIQFSPFIAITSATPMSRNYLIDKPYPGNLGRFDYVFQLAESELNKDRWMIFTDSYDVYFQSPLPDFSKYQSFDVLVADEGEKWADSWWFKKYLTENGFESQFNYLAQNDKYIMNAGTWAMKVKTFLDFFSYIQDNRQTYMNVGFSDQPMYNEWLYKTNKKFLDVPGLFGCLYKNLDIGRIQKTDGVFTNLAGMPYSIVHGNGNKKDVL